MDIPEVRRIIRADLRAGHFPADNPYISVLEDVEHRAEHAQVWVAEAAGTVVAALMLTLRARLGILGRADGTNVDRVHSP
ncbi:hypothetical protein ACFWIX_05800 [Pseudarthrobacter sp. NPDC058362]|uniref:hypothetical protein n=1 Tax=Pseudarthrobacter sp. NPDC058362 TaxID=3346458 RepID=UPI00365A1189